MVIDLQTQYTLQGNSHAGRLINVNTDGCVIEGDAKADIGEVLFLSFEKGIPLGGFKGKVIGQTFQAGDWTMGVYFINLTRDEKDLLFERISYFSFLQEKQRKKMEELEPKERRPLGQQRKPSSQHLGGLHAKEQKRAAPVSVHSGIEKVFLGIPVLGGDGNHPPRPYQVRKPLGGEVHG